VNDDQAIKILSALAQPTRFQVFRELIKVGEAGLRAGVLADALSVPQNTMSGHLSVLTNAGVIHSIRKGRELHYKLDHDAVRVFMTYLTEDCCEGRPELCGLANPSNNQNC